MRVVVSFIVIGLLTIILMLGVQKYFGVPPVSPTGVVAHSFDLNVDEVSESILNVRASGSDQILAGFHKGTFAYSVFRNMRSERKRNRVDVKGPFRLVRYETGELALKDLATGSSVYIKAFGPSNAEDFNRLFEASLSRHE